MRRTTVRRSPRRTGPSRALAPIATLALVALAATACSDDDGGDDSDDGDERQAPLAALTSAQIDEALLQAENLGEGWTSAPGTEGDTDPEIFQRLAGSSADEIRRRAGAH